jgi:hypothetical protein
LQHRKSLNTMFVPVLCKCCFTTNYK